VIGSDLAPAFEQAQRTAGADGVLLDNR
jgi:hypothetical protein